MIKYPFVFIAQYMPNLYVTVAWTCKLDFLLKKLLIRMASELTLQKIITLACYFDQLTYFLHRHRPSYVYVNLFQLVTKCTGF